MHLVNTLENTIDFFFLHPFYRNQVALIAFTLPQNWQHGSGLSIVATHVDSPNLKVGLFFSLASAAYSARRSGPSQSVPHPHIFRSVWKHTVVVYGILGSIVISLSQEELSFPKSLARSTRGS